MADAMQGFDTQGTSVRLPVFMAGWAIDGRPSSKDDIKEIEANTLRLLHEASHVPPVNFGHMYCEPEAPMRGYVTNVEAAMHTDGNDKPIFALFADIFLFEDTHEAYTSGRYPKVSAEIATEVSMHTGEKMGLALMGVAMLGSSVPAFPQLYAGGLGSTALPLEFKMFFDEAAKVYKFTHLTPGKLEGVTKYRRKLNETVTKLFNLLKDNTTKAQIKKHEVTTMDGDKKTYEDSAEVGARLKEIGAELAEIGEYLEMPADGEPAEDSDFTEAPDGESMKGADDKKEDKDKEKDEGDYQMSPAIKKQLAEAEADKLKFEASAKDLQAKLDAKEGAESRANVDQAFNSLHAKGLIAQGHKPVFESVAKEHGLDKAVATFSTGAGVPTPKSAMLDDSTGQSLGSEYESLGEISDVELLSIESYKKAGYDAKTITAMLQSGRNYAAQKRGA